MPSKRAASTKKANKFRLKSKPKKPVRRKFDNRISVDDGISLQGILREIQNVYDITLNPEDVVIEKDYDGYDDYHYVYATWKLEEPEEDFQRRLENYKRRLAEWEKWYEENREQIEAVLEARRVAAEERARKRIADEQKRLRKELAKLEKDEKRLRK